MCRCEKPRWVLAARPGHTSSSISKCEECGDMFFGYPSEAENECKLWQCFFAALEASGITNKTAQAKLWGSHRIEIVCRKIKPDEITKLIPKFTEETVLAGIPYS